MKTSMICWSVMPRACMLAMRSLPGLDLSHPTISQDAMESPQPHLHRSRFPTRITSALGFSAAVAPPCNGAVFAARSLTSGAAGGVAGVCASAAATSVASSRLLLNGCMSFRIPHHCGAGVLHLDLARHQADKGAANQHQ